MFWWLNPLNYLKLLLEGLLLLSCVGTLAGLFGGQIWFLDLANHFKFLFLLVQGVGVVWLFLSKQRFALLLTLACLVLNLQAVAPYYTQPSPSNLAENKANRLRLMQMNLFFFNQDTPHVLQRIQEESPDVIAMEEVTRYWRGSLSQNPTLHKKYPYQRYLVEGDLGLMSKYPIEQFSGRQMVGDDVSPRWMASAQLRLGANQRTSLFLLHPTTPITPKGYQSQVEYFETLLRESPQAHRPMILIGDFNTTPWTARFQKLTQGLQVRDTQLGYGVQASWPSILPFIKIPIDHCLVSPDIQVVGRHVGAWTGSDHLPVIIDLSLPRRS